MNRPFESSGSPCPGTWSGSFGFPDTGLLLDPGRPFFPLNLVLEKRWCYLGVFHPKIIFGCAVIHLGYISSAFAFGFDRGRKQMTEHTLIFPPLGQVRFDRHPETGVTAWQGLRGKLRIGPQAGEGIRKIQAEFSSAGKSIHAELEIGTHGFRPMHFLMPMERGKRAFTAKAAGLMAQGKIRLNKESFELDPEKTFAVLDWTHGYYPRHTFWNWACGAGRALDGTRIGFNLSLGVYENGQLENTVWIEGRPEPVREAVFEYDPANPHLDWKISTRDDRIRLIFRPEGMRQADDNLFLVKSRFIQPCGTFEGQILSRDGTSFLLGQAHGVVESHDALW